MEAAPEVSTGPPYQDAVEKPFAARDEVVAIDSSIEEHGDGYETSYATSSTGQAAY